MNITTVQEVETVEFAPSPDLEGVPIRLNEASAKYGVRENTLSRWARSGLVRIIEQGPKLLVLDEASAAKAAAIYNQVKARSNPYRAGWVLKRAMLGA